MRAWAVVGALATVLVSVGPGLTQNAIRQTVPVDAAAVADDPAVRAVRSTYGACRPTAVQRLRVKLDRGPDTGEGEDIVALVDADCRRGPTQFVFIGLDNGSEAPEEVLLHLVPRPTYLGLAVDPQTRRMFGRTARGAEEVPWQRLTRDHLFRLRKPLREYAGLILPPVPTGPIPPLPAPETAAVAAAAPAPAAPPQPSASDAAARAQLEAEVRSAIEPELRRTLAVEIRQELAAEAQARLDRARELVERLQRDLETERAAAGRLRAEATQREEALVRERTARETAERLLGLAQAAERERNARSLAEQALVEARREAERQVSEARAAAERTASELAQQARSEAGRQVSEARAAAERALAEARRLAEQQVGEARDLAGKAEAEARRLASEAERLRAELAQRLSGATTSATSPAPAAPAAPSAPPQQ